MNTFGRDLQLATFGDLDCLQGAVARGSWGVFNLFNDFVALENFAENNVSTVEPSIDCVLDSYF
jgi:hypothetical protein